MRSYLLIILSALASGVVTVLYKKSTNVIGPINTTFYYYLFGTIITFVVWIFFKRAEPVRVEDLVYPGLIAIGLSFSIISFNFGLAHAKVSIAGTIRSFSFVFTIVLALIFFKEKLTIKQIIGVVLAIASMLMLTS